MRRICFSVLIATNALFGATYPPGFTEQLVAAGIVGPTTMAFAPDGRIFICEKTGALRVVKNGVLLSTPFVTLDVNSTGERGLEGVTIDPGYQTNKYIYVYYTTASAPVHNRVSRFTANTDTAAPGSETPILELDTLSTTSSLHNGGAIRFGLDGKLYIATGDNGTGGNAQSLASRMGKILRVNPDGSIPPDNPLLSQTSGVNQAIWALGLRNPFSLAVHPLNGRIHINDVGEDVIEEVNEGVAGANYGWNRAEGPDNGNPAFRDPIAWYNHTNGTPFGCAVVGAAFNAGTKYPGKYYDGYFYADFCSQWIYYLPGPNYTAQTPFATDLGKNVVDLQIWEGELYFLSRDTRSLYRVSYTSANDPPVVVQQPASLAVAAGQGITFTVTATGSPTLAYQWQKNGIAIPGATSPNLIVSVAAADNGARFRCLVSNSFGSTTSNEAILTVIGNSPPVPVIETPADGAAFVPGQTVNYSGTATDAQDGSPPASAFTWRVDLLGGEKQRVLVQPVTGSKTGSFSATFPEQGIVTLRVYLTVTDSAGASTTVFRDLQMSSGPAAGLRLKPTTPCRLVDTRAGEGLTGAFGPPFLAASATREIPVPAGRCGVPATAKAYSLNVTVVPKGPLGYLSLWPAGQTQPVVSTLNSFHGGVVANAAVVPAGTAGAINVFVTNATDVILDINGYFDVEGQAFYAVDPCRVADTRNAAGVFGGPLMGANTTRDLPVASSPCGVPATAAAYSMNVTVVPQEPLSFLTEWPAGAARPVVSTLNSFDSAVVANAELVPAGAGGAVSTFVTNRTDVIHDINGYFAAPGQSGSLQFYTVTPCRITDTRQNGPVMSANQRRDFQIGGSCGVPSTAKAYSLNVTVVPDGALGFLSLWPAGKPQPLVSTLNSFLGRVVANAALVPAGTNGAVSVYVTNQTHVILDVNGFFQ